MVQFKFELQLLTVTATQVTEAESACGPEVCASCLVELVIYPTEIKSA